MTAFHAGLIWLRVQDHPAADALTFTDRAVLSVLFSFAQQEAKPRAFASADKIAKRAGCDRRTVQRALDRLEGLEIIEGEHRHRRPTIWTPCADFLPGEISGTKSPGKRQRVPLLASESPTGSGTKSHQLTEGSFRLKGRKQTEDSADACSARAPQAPRTVADERGLPKPTPRLFRVDRQDLDGDHTEISVLPAKTHDRNHDTFRRMVSSVRDAMSLKDVMPALRKNHGCVENDVDRCGAYLDLSEDEPLFSIMVPTVTYASWHQRIVDTFTAAEPTTVPNTHITPPASLRISQEATK